MKLGYVTLSGRGAIDALLAQVAALLEAGGLRLAGTVQTNLERTDRRCDMDLRLLPDGPTVRISVDRGAEARGCRLDAGALEQVVAEVQSRLEGAQALLVNKFGKQEAAGRALVPVIGEACARGLPVLVGVAPQWREAFLGFAGDAALPLPDDAGLALDWLRQSCLARI